MKTLHTPMIVRLFLFVHLSALIACSQGPESLAADKRPIPALLAEDQRESLRKLPFEGAHNFRDLGGYKTSDGRQLKWGLIYRSDKLSDLTADDEYYMERLQLKRIVDFRSNIEREAEPSRVAPDSSIGIERWPLEVADLQLETIKNEVESSGFTKQKMNNLSLNVNRELVEKYTPIYRDWIQSILQKNGLPMAFHCSTGKDRTGFAAALILLAVGVPKATVIADNVATNTYTSKQIEKELMRIKFTSLFQADTEEIRSIMTVEPEFIAEAFRAIDEHYGSIDNYMEQGLGLDVSKRLQLKNLLTENAVN